MRENLELMRQFNATAEANYRSGAAPLQDTLRSQTELAKMETEIANNAACDFPSFHCFSPSKLFAKAQRALFLVNAADTPNSLCIDTDGVV
jgi:hypothetical protein